MQKKRRIIYIAGFLFSMAVALISYINSSFLENFLDEKYVGIVYTVASLLTILSLLATPKLLKKLGNRKLIIYSLILFFLCLIVLALGGHYLFVIPAFILYFILMWAVYSFLDIFIEDFSLKKSIGSARGLYLTILSSAWVIAQLISGTVLDKVSFTYIYLISASFVFLVILMFLFSLKDFKDPQYLKISIGQTIRSFWVNKNISKIYFSNLILRFFYATMVIYTPIYLHEYIGFGWDQIGIIFSIMLLPFVILDYPLGKLSDKIGEKELLVTGFIIMSCAVFLIPFIKNPDLFIWAGVLFATRIGAATIETMNDAYFFKVVAEEDANEISFFRNASAVAYVITPIVISVFLIFSTEFKNVFFLLFAVVIVGFLNGIRIKDVQ